MAGDARVRALARRNRHEEKTPHHGVPATQTPQTVGETAGRRRGLVQMTAPPGVPPSLRGPRYKRSSSSRPSSGPPGSDTAATRLGHRKYSGTFFHLSTSTARRAIAPHHICCGQPSSMGTRTQLSLRSEIPFETPNSYPTLALNSKSLDKPLSICG